MEEANSRDSSYLSLKKEVCKEFGSVSLDVRELRGQLGTGNAGGHARLTSRLIANSKEGMCGPSVSFPWPFKNKAWSSSHKRDSSSASWCEYGSALLRRCLPRT
jgi:hypothetical protein